MEEDGAEGEGGGGGGALSQKLYPYHVSLGMEVLKINVTGSELYP